MNSLANIYIYEHVIIYFILISLIFWFLCFITRLNNLVYFADRIHAIWGLTEKVVLQDLTKEVEDYKAADRKRKKVMLMNLLIWSEIYIFFHNRCFSVSLLQYFSFSTFVWPYINEFIMLTTDEDWLTCWPFVYVSRILSGCLHGGQYCVYQILERTII